MAMAIGLPFKYRSLVEVGILELFLFVAILHFAERYFEHSEAIEQSYFYCFFQIPPQTFCESNCYSEDNERFDGPELTLIACSIYWYCAENYHDLKNRRVHLKLYGLKFTFEYD